jgi:hypothetical protein
MHTKGNYGDTRPWLLGGRQRVLAVCCLRSCQSQGAGYRDQIALFAPSAGPSGIYQAPERAPICTYGMQRDNACHRHPSQKDDGNPWRAWRTCLRQCASFPTQGEVSTISRCTFRAIRSKLHTIDGKEEESRPGRCIKSAKCQKVSS